jgi:hypothetical protein
MQQSNEGAYPAYRSKDPHVVRPIDVGAPPIRGLQHCCDANTHKQHPEFVPLVLDLALQLPFLKICESMGNHDSNIVDAGSVD